jgi:hypothetical protein
MLGPLSGRNRTSLVRPSFSEMCRVGMWRGGGRLGHHCCRLFRVAVPYEPQPWLRFRTPLIEPDLRSCRIRLSDKTSRFRPRHVVPKPIQAYETVVPVKVREWIAPALASLDAR